MRRPFFRTIPFLVVLALTAACDDSTPDTTTPTSPSGAITTETFEGTLIRNGATTFTLTTASSGTVTATLVSIAPDTTIPIGFSLGTWNGTGCQAVISNDRATMPASIIGQATTTGTLCVRIYDVGTLVDPQDYEIDVTHP